MSLLQYRFVLIARYFTDFIIILFSDVDFGRVIRGFGFRQPNFSD